MVTLNSLQHLSQRHGDEVTVSVTVSYSSQESFSYFVLQEALKQDTIFHALQMINDVQRLNGGKRVLSDWDVKLIKDYFKNEKVNNRNDKPYIGNRKNESTSFQIVNNKIDITEIEISKIHMSKVKRQKENDIQRKLKLGYMKMLSNQI